ncbi:MAG: hypothetical protein V7646_5459 [Pseudonocardia sp.]|jgi:hypothetical protein
MLLLLVHTALSRDGRGRQASWDGPHAQIRGDPDLTVAVLALPITGRPSSAGNTSPVRCQRELASHRTACPV